MEKRYKSKIALWLVLPILLVFTFILVLMFLEPVAWYLIAFISFVFLFMIQLFFNTYYVIEEKILHIRAGVFYRLNIDVASIRKIEESNSPLSAPAISFDRLEIVYNKFDSVLVSPKDKMDFVEHLRSLNPKVEFIPRKY